MALDYGRRRAELDPRPQWHGDRCVDADLADLAAREDVTIVETERSTAIDQEQPEDREGSPILQ